MTTPERETERQEAVRLANRILDRPWADPDDDLAVLSRQFLRALEREEIAQRSASSALLAAKAEEREACAAALDKRADYLAERARWSIGLGMIFSTQCEVECREQAAAIRARGAPAAVKEPTNNG